MQKAEIWDITDVMARTEFLKELTISSGILFKHYGET